MQLVMNWLCLAFKSPQQLTLFNIILPVYADVFHWVFIQLKEKYVMYLFIYFFTDD